MVKYYQELTILPDGEVSENHIWGKLYQSVHIALSDKLEEERGRIGVSFPHYSLEGLGDKLRIFAETKEELLALNMQQQVARYRDYVHVKGIAKVPEHVTWATFKRRHNKGNPAKLARRYAKRHNVSFDEAIKIFSEQEHRKLPYVVLRSDSNGYEYRLSVEKIDKEEVAEMGFGSYGLDNQSTVPVF